MTRDGLDFVNLEDLQAQAKQRLEGAAYDYVAGGAEDETTLRENVSAFSRWRFVPEVLRDVSEVDTSLELLGRRWDFPVAVAPTAFHGLMHPEAERATARGAAEAGALYVASTMSNASLAEIAASVQAPRWFQVYVFRDRSVTERMVDEAAQHGYEALVLTADVPVGGRRERDHRNRFHLPEGLPIGNLPGLAEASRSDEARTAIQHTTDEFDASLTWEAVEWLRDVSGLPVLVKGVLSASDASLALEAGAAGVVVSNHGGRQLDSAVASLDALPGVAAAVGGKAPVLFDGGVRRGTDVAKALCLGADAVLVGRPVLWGLAVAGAEGVAAVLRRLNEELVTAMRLLGTTGLGEMDRGRVVEAGASVPR